MEQTESRSIRQLWKDRRVMFLLSLLVLLMGIQVTFACECQEADLLRAMCPSEIKAVIWGRLLNESCVNSTSHSGMSILHHVELSHIFKEGSTSLTWFKGYPGRIIRMISPEGCSLVDTDEWTEFLIYGETDADGILHSSKCTAVLKEGYFQARPYYYEIMTGSHDNPKCRGDS